MASTVREGSTRGNEDLPGDDAIAAAKACVEAIARHPALLALPEFTFLRSFADDQRAAPRDATAERASAPDREAPKPPWRKVLYERQPYEDNYVDASFLSAITTSPPESLDLSFLVLDALVATQQLSIVAIFGCVFMLLLRGTVSLAAVLVTEGASLVVGFWLHARLGSATVPSTSRTRAHQKGHFQTVRLVLLFGGVLLALSPMLRTLTTTWSNDTICAVTVCLFFSHLVSHDYSAANEGGAESRLGTLSFNLAIFGSELLASRLPDAAHVFALMTLAVALFALFPELRRRVRGRSVRLHIALACGLLLTAATAVALLSRTIAIVYALACLLVSFLGPLGLMYMQCYKRDFRGPWDEAVRAHRLLQDSEEGPSPVGR